MTKETSEKVVELSKKIRRVEIVIYASYNIVLTDQETREFLADVLNSRKKALAELKEQLEQL